MSKTTGTERPRALELQPDSIPDDLTRLSQWVVWRYTADTETDASSWDKPLLNAHTLRAASSTNPKTWSDWQTALSAYRTETNDLDGVGFVLHRANGEVGPGLVGIDLDDCRCPETGEIEPWAMDEVRRFDTYTEMSPSGRGLRLFVVGELPPRGRKRGKVECYDHARYVTVTGHELPDSPGTIEHRQEQLLAFHAEHFPERDSSWESHESEYVSPLTDLEIVEKAKSSKAGVKFSRLWAGDYSGYTSRSEADLALCNHLAFWTGPDRNRIADLFAQSGLYRSKWKREDYREWTIGKALSGRTEYYSPNGKTPHMGGSAPGSWQEYEEAHVPGGNQKNSDKKQSGYRFDVLDSATFAEGDYRPTWLVKRLLVAGQPAVIGAAKKTLKTSLAVDLAISLASEEPFLGTFDVYSKVRVAILSAESGQATLQETANRICASKGISLSSLGDSLVWGFDLPQLANATDLAELRRGLSDHETDVLIVDPLYLSMLAGMPEASASNLYQMGPLFRTVGKLCEDVGTTPILIHHATKHFPIGEVMELDHLAYSGLAEFARQWMLLSRREAFDPGQESDVHHLWLSVGGSGGQSGLWGIDVDEGKLDENFGGRKWDVVVESSQGVRDDQKNKEHEKKTEAQRRESRADGTRLLTELDKLVQLGKSQNGAVSKNNLRDKCKFSSQKVNRVIFDLLEERALEEVEMTYRTGQNLSATKTGTGYRRPQKQPKIE